jgi:hypothetical protein
MSLATVVCRTNWTGDGPNARLEQRERRGASEAGQDGSKQVVRTYVMRVCVGQSCQNLRPSVPLFLFMVLGGLGDYNQASAESGLERCVCMWLGKSTSRLWKKKLAVCSE